MARWEVLCYFVFKNQAWNPPFLSSPPIRGYHICSPWSWQSITTSHLRGRQTKKKKRRPSAPSDILFFQWAGNNLKRDCLIDPSNPQEWAYHFKETVFGTQRDEEVQGKRIKQKHDEKQRKGKKKITSDDGIRNCLMPTWLIILRISLCGRSFWRWLFVSHCDWNNNDSSLVFLLFAVRKRQKNMLFSSTGANTERSLLLQGARGTLDLRPSFLWLYRLCWVFPR